MNHTIWTRAASVLSIAMLMLAGLLGGHAALAQGAVTASIHGHVTQADGRPFNRGEVKLTSDRDKPPADRKYPYAFPISTDGDFKGAGISAGQYIAVVYADSKVIDYQDITLKPGDDLAVNFDMTRAEYLNHLTPEERKAIEDTKAKNAAAIAYNAKVGDLNKGIGEASADIKAGKTADAVTVMKGLSVQAPDQPLIWIKLGEAELADGNAEAAKARQSHLSTSDPAVVAHFTDAAAAFKKGLELNAASKKPDAQIAAPTERNLGEALIKGGDAAGAKAAYDEAAKLDPAHAGQTYYLEAATFFNNKQNDDAEPAAQKAIDADPKNALPYYIKGQALIAHSTVNGNKIVAPPGCVEAYQMYLELDPNGQFAAEVKGLLTSLGQSIKSTYRKGH